MLISIKNVFPPLITKDASKSTRVVLYQMIPNVITMDGALQKQDKIVLDYRDELAGNTNTLLLAILLSTLTHK
ncbi:MAG: hypothetical protein CL862_04670 [Cyanobium sp. NAT70]|nr:hypothetical protein [Cyanobium sp. NAT70]